MKVRKDPTDPACILENPETLLLLILNPIN